MNTETIHPRRNMIEQAIASYKERGERKTLTIEYRGTNLSLEVVRIPPQYLLLNHDNSRLSAQLFDHPKKNIVQKDPTSSEAQDVLASLLRKTERFAKLKEELKELKQQNPGLISRDGLLINGNTRVVALRDLGSDGVDVAVLPADALSKDFLDLEMSLQMRKLTHQDYTFTNELLLIDKYRMAGHTDKELAKKMGWLRGGQKKIDLSISLLSLIKEIRALTSPPLAFEVFDAKSQHLKDLLEEYESLALADLSQANSMKWSRIISMFLGVNKDQTRVIDPEFFDTDVLVRITNDSSARALIDSHRKISFSDGLDELLEDTQQPVESIDLRALAKNIIEKVSTNDGVVIKDLPSDLQEIHNAIRLGAEAQITKSKRESLLLEPSSVLQETRIGLEGLLDALPEISGSRGFDVKKFEYELSRVQACLAEIEASIRE